MQSSPTSRVLCIPYLDPQTCSTLVDTLPADRWHDGLIARPTDVQTLDELADDTVRSCRIHRGLEAAFVDAVTAHIRAICESVFGFDIDGYRPDDPPQVMRYSPGDHFAWHVDNGTDAPPVNTRKLAFSIQLSDPASYDGGDLQLGMYQQDYRSANAEMTAAMRTQGVLIVFAAFQLHRVTPVTRGHRDALVGWLHGPPFR